MLVKVEVEAGGKVSLFSVLRFRQGMSSIIGGQKRSDGEVEKEVRVVNL